MSVFLLTAEFFYYYRARDCTNRVNAAPTVVLKTFCASAVKGEALSLLFEEEGKRRKSPRVSGEIALKREREREHAKDTALIYVPGAEVASQRRATS